jgi:hypothetical protein
MRTSPLVVARHNITDRRSLERTCQILRSQGFPRPAWSSTEGSGAAHYKYYGYKQQSYHGSELNA